MIKRFLHDIKVIFLTLLAVAVILLIAYFFLIIYLVIGIIWYIKSAQ